MILSRDQRAIVAGRTGTGKSTWACWAIAQTPQHWIILNPKHTGAYTGLPDSKILTKISTKKLDSTIESNKYTIFNPETGQAHHDYLDEIIGYLHERWDNIGILVDELYTLHNRGIAGSGLIGWLTRGREKNQSFLGLTQRPCWVSQFLFSESDFIGGFDLTLKKDRQRMVEMTGREAFAQRLPDRQWLWYSTGEDSLKKFLAITPKTP